MKFTKSVLRGLTSAMLGGAAFVALSGAAFAADLKGLKDAPVVEAEPDYKITVNGGLTTDYVFRGISQSNEDLAVFAGADLAYRMFYVGVWASSVDEFVSDGDIEVDIYGGIKKSYNGVDFDLGVIYYAYPGNSAGDIGVELDYVEIKAAASSKIWREITLTGAVFYSPDYYAESGETWTLEAKASAPLPIWGLTLSGTLGHVYNADDNDVFFASYGDDSYTYWNIGLSKTFKDHFTVDVRYWDTNVDVPGGFANSELLNDLADERIVATVTFNY